MIIYGGTTGIAAVQSGDVLQADAPLNSAEMMNTLDESNKNLSAITSDFKIVNRKLANGEGTVGELITNDSIAKHLEATAVLMQRLPTIFNYLQQISQTILPRWKEKEHLRMTLSTIPFSMQD